MSSAPEDTRVHLSAAGISIPGEHTEVLDLLFDDDRVFTMTPERWVERDGRRLVSWPSVLAPYLTGQTDVTLREHVSGRVLFRGPYRFDDSEGRTRVVDAQGYPLAMDKWGFLVRTFGSSSRALVDALLDDVDELLSVLHRIGVPAFIAYGTLLGAVRGGSLIGHDNDADISYLSAHEDPADIVTESYWIERGLRDAGWRVLRSTGAFLQVWRDDDADEQRKIDIFTSHFQDADFWIERWVRAPLPRSALLPLGTVMLEGRTFPAPARPEDVLAATYGDGWRVPDPDFAFRIPVANERRSSGWFGEFWQHQVLWAKHAASSPEQGISFSSWVASQVEVPSRVVDVGCGTGGDAVRLALGGHQAVGVDYSKEALALAHHRATEAGVRVDLECFSLEDLRATLTSMARLAVGSGSATAACSRNLLNALPVATRDTFWHGCRVLLAAGGPLLLEYVDPVDDVGEPQTPPPPASRLPDPDVIRGEVESHGGTVTHESHPVVDGLRRTRMVVRWRPAAV